MVWKSNCAVPVERADYCSGACKGRVINVLGREENIPQERNVWEQERLAILVYMPGFTLV